MVLVPIVLTRFPVLLNYCSFSMTVLRLLIAPLKFKRRKIDEPNDIYTQQLSTVLTARHAINHLCTFIEVLTMARTKLRNTSGP